MALSIAAIACPASSGGRRSSLGYVPIQIQLYTLDNLTARALDTRQSEGVQIRSFQLAIERLRARPGLASILIHKPGPLFDESPARQAAIAGVYRRGLEEVGVLLAGVRAQPG